MADLNFLNRVAQNGGAIPDELRTEPANNAEADALRARLTRLGIKFHHKTGEEKLRELLNAELDDTTHGLSRRELCASLEAAEVEFDPDAPHADLVAALEAAKASKTENA